MPVDKKILDRIAKLLRTASPDGGASENERSIAALEAARLIGENKLIVTEEAGFFSKRTEPAPTPARSWVKTVVDILNNDAAWQGFSQGFYNRGGSDYREIFNEDWDAVCGVCGRKIGYLERAFFDAKKGIRCYNITCDQNDG